MFVALRNASGVTSLRQQTGNAREAALAELCAFRRDNHLIFDYTPFMPTIHREGPYRFFFNSREETRMHVHVETADGNAKFWLEPLVALSTFHNLSSKELSRSEQIVRERQNEFINAWRRHFRV